MFNIAFDSTDLHFTFFLLRNKAKEVEELTSQFRQRDQDNEMNNKKSVDANCNLYLFRSKCVAVIFVFFPREFSTSSVIINVTFLLWHS